MNIHPIRKIIEAAVHMLAPALLGLVLGTLALHARAEFPDHPIRLVVGYGPGTGSDIQGRALADQLSKELKTTVIVDNRPGASGMLAGASVANAPADGYTLLFGTTAMLVTGPLLSKNTPYDSDKSFAPISGLAKAPFVILVANKAGAPESLAELLKRLKAGTGGSYGTTGVGTFGHLAAVQLLRSQSVTDVVHVPYKSSAQVFQDVIAGNLLFTVDSSTAGLPLVRSGLLRPLAVTSRVRLPSLAKVPTVAEVLGNDFEQVVWTGLLAPRGTPEPVIQRLYTATSAALNAPELQARFTQMELQPFNLASRPFADFIRAELPAWKSFLERNGIHGDE